MRDYLRELRRWAAFGCLEASRVPLGEFLGAFGGWSGATGPTIFGGPRWFPVFGCLSRLCG